MHVTQPTNIAKLVGTNPQKMYTWIIKKNKVNIGYLDQCYFNTGLYRLYIGYCVLK